MFFKEFKTMKTTLLLGLFIILSSCSNSEKNRTVKVKFSSGNCRLQLKTKLTQSISKKIIEILSAGSSTCKNIKIKDKRGSHWVLNKNGVVLLPAKIHISTILPPSNSSFVYDAVLSSKLF